jgi:hypothetical protein
VKNVSLAKTMLREVRGHQLGPRLPAHETELHGRVGHVVDPPVVTPLVDTTRPARMDETGQTGPHRSCRFAHIAVVRLTGACHGRFTTGQHSVGIEREHERLGWWPRRPVGARQTHGTRTSGRALWPGWAGGPGLPSRTRLPHGTRDTGTTRNTHLPLRTGRTWSAGNARWTRVARWSVSAHLAGDTGWALVAFLARDALYRLDIGDRGGDAFVFELAGQNLAVVVEPIDIAAEIEHGSDGATDDEPSKRDRQPECDQMLAADHGPAAAAEMINTTIAPMIDVHKIPSVHIVSVRTPATSERTRSSCSACRSIRTYGAASNLATRAR